MSRKALAAGFVRENAARMAAGYVDIADRLSSATREQGSQQLAAAIASLKQLGSDDAKFFAGQLESVAKLFD